MVKCSSCTEDTLFSDSHWEMVLPDALHSIRALLSTSMNTSPHEILFGFQRRSSCGTSHPSWLSAPGSFILRRFIRHTKNAPLVDEVNVIDINPLYTHIHYPDGRESTASIKYLSTCPAPPIAIDLDPTSPLSHMNNDITTNKQAPTQSSANYMNHEISENPVSQPIPANSSKTADTVIRNATTMLSHMNNDITTNNQTPTQSSTNYINYEINT